MCVTPLAQVAALADTQIMVTKTVTAGSASEATTTATARIVEGDDRVDEIARMLSGEQAGESARLHAADLLADRLRLS
jgi:DNA repair protein RecN (Recombination protein N)